MTRRLMAGFFIGVSSLLMIGGGIYSIIDGKADVGFALIATGTAPLTSMLSFFVGETNGKKLAAT